MSRLRSLKSTAVLGGMILCLFSQTVAANGTQLPGSDISGSIARSLAAIPNGLTVSKAGTGFGTVTSNSPGINCGIDCDEQYGSATPVTLMAMPEPASTFMGWLGACTGTATCQVNVSGTTNVSATFAPFTILPMIDIDGNGIYDPWKDGLLMLRYLFGLRGAALINGAVGTGAKRASEPDIVLWLDNIRPILDVDGNGASDALSDGLMLSRYLFDLTGESLIRGTIGGGASRTTAGQIESYLQSITP